MKGPFILVLISALIAAPLFADTITLKSGEKYTGEIVEETNEYIRLKTDSKILKIKRTAIAKVSTPEVEVEVELEEPKLSSLADARAKAEAAAEAEVNKMLWAGLGFLLGIIGVVVAYAVVPSPPHSQLIGKSAQYAETFSDAYTSKARSIQTTQAIVGCLVGTAVSLACWLMIFTLGGGEVD